MAFEKFTRQAKMPVERIPDRDASPNRRRRALPAVQDHHTIRLTCRVRSYSLAIVIGVCCGVTAAEICDAIRKAANTAGTLTSLRN
jgi:hypothetical protein